jgi:hypothetical protein
MSDNFPGEITIGGSILRATLEQLKALIIEQGCKIEYGELWTENELEKAFTTTDSVMITDDSARYGEMKEIKEFLVQNKIPFNAHSDARYEFDAVNTYYRGDNEYVFFATQEGTDLLNYNTVSAIVYDDRFDSDKKIEAIKELLTATDLPKLRIVETISRG